MRSCIVLLSFLFCFSSHALESASADRLKRSDTIYSENQKRLKAAYEKSKSQALKRNAEINHGDAKNQKPLKMLSGCKGLQCGSNWAQRKSVLVEKRISAWTGSLKSYVYGTYYRLKGHAKAYARNLKTKIPMLSQKKMLSAPPEAGGIAQARSSSGSRPFVDFWTDQEIADPDGTVEQIVWDFGDGTSQSFAADELPSNAWIRHVYPRAGHYSVTLTLVDNDNDETTYQVYTEIYTNELPVPTFSVDQNVGASPLTVNFTSNGGDPEDRIDQYGWQYGDGNLDYGIEYETIQHEYADPGIYKVQFEIRDQDYGNFSTFAEVFVDTTPPAWGSVPSLVFQSTDLVGAAPHSVYYDASKSFDIDGTIAEYEWDFGDYNSPYNTSTEAAPHHKYVKPGTYYGRLLVRDGDGGESEYYFDVYVQGTEPLAPQIIAFQDGGRNIRFDGGQTSMRAAATWDRYVWDFGDGNGTTGAGPTHEYSNDDTYTVSLNVKDIFGNTFLVTKDVFVIEDWDSPDAKISLNNRRFDLSEQLQIDASASTDPGQSLALDYRIDFGDGTQFESDVASHYYDEAGLYVAEVVVTNTRGISSLNARQVAVRDGSRPLAKLNFTPIVGNAPLTVNFDASVSSSDAGPLDYLIKINNDIVSTGSTAEYTFNDPGFHYVELIVRDAAGNFDFDDGDIIAVDSGSIPVGNSPPDATFTFSADPGDSYWYDFDALGTVDPDNDQMVFEWKINGVEMGHRDWLSYRFPTSNIYLVELTVYDQWGASDIYSQTIDLSNVAEQQLTFDYAPIKPIAGQTIKFGADFSVVPGSTIVSYDWDFGDSSAGTGVNPTHSYSSAGTYTVELTLTDSLSNTFTTSKDVVVGSANSNPNLKITARDVDLLTEVTNSGTYRGTTFPETVHLSIRSTADSNKFIRNATWNLGDGKTAYGPDVEYTYNLPGTYNVSVTGYDANGLSNTAGLTIVVPNDCKRQEGQTDCLILKGLSQNVLPFSATSWTIERTGNYSSDPVHFPAKWIYLKALDGSDDIVDLSPSVTVTANEVEISKQSLVDRNINFARPYKIVVNTVDSSDNPIFAETPKFYFGVGSIQVIWINDADRLRIIHPSARFSHYMEWEPGVGVRLSNIPLGPVVVVAETGSQALAYHTVLKDGTVKILDLDDPVEPIIPAKESKAPKSLLARWKERELWATKDDTKKTIPTVSSWPAWSHDLCGTPPPFNPVKPRNIPVNQTTIWPFFSNDPDAQSTLRSIPTVVTKPVRLNCAVYSESLMYGYVRWKYKDGPQRCLADHKPHWYWNWYLKNFGKYEDSPISIRYTVNDQWTGETYRDVVVTSAAAMRQAMGRELTDITQRVGLIADDNLDWAYRQSFDIYIPPHFKRPTISFNLVSKNNEVENEFYQVQCDVTSTGDSQPKAVRLRPTELNSTSDRVSRNGQYSLQSRYKFFPVQYDDRSTSAVSIDADVAKAKYEISIRYYNQSTINWQGVDVEFDYNGQTHLESYAFDGTPVLDEEQGIYRNTFSLDTSVLEEIFDWAEEENFVTLKITPKGEDAEANPVTGLPMTEQFIALFDVQNVQHEGFPLCSNGYFGTKYTAFAQDGMIRALIKASDGGAQLRCSNISLPFGGPMNVSGMTQDTYRDGMMTRARTFTKARPSGVDPTWDPDLYDGSGASLRRSDIDAYIAFSEAALAISQIVDEYDGIDPTDKKKIYNYCRPSSVVARFPCTLETQFADLNHDMVLQICQLYYPSGVVDGCPANFMDEVIRFSKWVKYNVDSLSQLRNSILHPSYSSGLYFDSGEFKPYQKLAIVYGVWPDGKPIWAVSPTGSSLRYQRVATCHENRNGCEAFKPFFSGDNYYVDSMEIINGWRL